MTNHKHSHKNLPWLAGAVLACAVLAAPATQAQTITSVSASPTSSAGTTPPPDQSVGQVAGSFRALPSTSAPEAINSAGAGTTTTTVSVDPNGGPTVVELYFDFSTLKLTGAKSGQAYHTTGQGRVTRILAASDQYVATLPIWTTNAAGKTSEYTITATFNMAFNTTTNVLTSMSVALGDYVAPASAGGGIVLIGATP